MLEIFSQIPILSCICLAVAVFIAIMNMLALVYNIRHNGSTSFVFFVGLIFFYFGTLGWDEPIYFWLLSLIDIGTVLGLFYLPFLIKDIFSNSIFARHAIYQNNEQILTLYKTKNTQNFDWRWVDKVPDNIVAKQQPFMNGFGGNWTMSGNQLFLKSYNGIIATANILENKIVFEEVKSDIYYSLENAVLWQKFKK